MNNFIHQRLKQDFSTLVEKGTEDLFRDIEKDG